jgi:hypothetical protein
MFELVQRLGVSGAVPVIHLCAFMVYTGTTLPSPLPFPFYYWFFFLLSTILNSENFKLDLTTIHVADVLAVCYFYALVIQC